MLSRKKYKLVALGGTFDLLHQGHKALIDRAFLVGEKVVIGITSSKFDKNKSNISRLEKRKEKLIAYLKSKNYFSRGEIVEINDLYGPTIINPLFEAIIVSEETTDGAEKINRVRKIKGLKPLKIIKIPMIKDENGGIISSSRIRLGEINREGFVYQNLFKKTIIVSKTARQELKKPQGIIIKNIDLTNRIRVAPCQGCNPVLGRKNGIILVGDLSVRKFLDADLLFDIGIIDLMVERKPKNLFSKEFLEENIKLVVKNKAGTISPDLVRGLMREMGVVREVRERGGRLIMVIGEEDLAAVPAILLSPLGTLVFYGQPKKGLVMVEVTEEIKERIKNLLLK